MPPRRDGIPVIVDAAGQTERLERFSLSDKEISEGWLQQRLDDCPELLPINEIDPGFGPLISIGREIGTDVGPMDNLYISPQGTLTLVEAKLWRNPEARRQVIGQILDYAKEMSLWSYDALDKKTREVSGKSLWELVSSNDDTLEEARFVDSVVRNLKCGRFLLLIVGDGIREEMERLTTFLQESPQLRFTLALVELQIYRLTSNERYLVMPIIVGRTLEITRAVVRVESTQGAKVNVALEIDGGDDDASPGTRRRKLTKEDFFEGLASSGASAEGIDLARRLYDDFDDDDRFQIDFGTASYVIKLRDPVEKNQLYTILVVESAGRAYLGWLGGQLTRAGLPIAIAEQFATKSAELLGRKLHATYNDCWDRPADLKMIADNYVEFTNLIDAVATAVYAPREPTTP